MNIENKCYLLHQRHKGITFHIAWINAIYSASVVLKVIFVCNLLQYNTGHPAHQIM